MGLAGPGQRAGTGTWTEFRRQNPRSPHSGRVGHWAPGALSVAIISQQLVRNPVGAPKRPGYGLSSSVSN